MLRGAMGRPRETPRDEDDGVARRNVNTCLTDLGKRRAIV